MGCAVPGGGSLPPEANNGSAGAQARGRTRVAPRAGSLVPRRLRSRLAVVVIAAVLARVDIPPGWAQEPEPLCDTRVFIRPQPTRPPHGEVMAPSPSWGWGSRPGAGRGPHPKVGWWQDGTGPDRNAAAAPRARRGQGRVCLPPPPPPTGRAVAVDRADGAHLLTSEWLGGRMEQLAATPHHHPPPPPPRPLHLPPCGLPPASFAHAMGTTWTGRRARVWACRLAPPLPLNRRRHYGLALPRCWYSQAAQVCPAPLGR